MKNTSVLAIAFALIILLSACQNSPAQADVSTSALPIVGQIYLYGEQHGVEKILDKEFELWYNYYHVEGMRHLFIEFPYYTTEFLNLWMQSDSDEILDAIYADWAGTAAQTPAYKDFLLNIKSQCPETTFHGTDVGHQYTTTGKRFLSYLQEKGLENSEQYQLAQQSIEQGTQYYAQPDDVYRENVMAENFARHFDKLKTESVMGIYGAAHTGLDAMNYTKAVPCMANQLKQLYGDAIRSEDLSWIGKDIDPYRVDEIVVNGKTYTAAYFGEQDISDFSKEYTSRAFWRLENAYDDFSDEPSTDDVLPYDDYPMAIKARQVFVIDYTKTDGSIKRMYYRSDDGYVWNGFSATVEFTVK